MSNTIKLKRGSGSDPSASDLALGELAIRTDNGKIFLKKDNGSVAEVSGGGGIDDGDKGDITVSNSGATFTIDNGVVTSAKIADSAITNAKLNDLSITSAKINANQITTAKIADNAVTTDKINPSAVTSAKIADGTIVNADINASAAIAGSKISPTFTSNVTVSNTDPVILLQDTDNDDDFAIRNHNGVFTVRDSTNGVDRLTIASDGTTDIINNLNVGAGLDITGDITGTGNLTLTSTDTGSAAAPEFELYRNSASPADADYLGQLKFTGESDDGSKEVYAKMTAKIDDASSGTEDGLFEFALRKAGSNNISARFTSTALKLINGTSLEVAGAITGTGNLTIDTNTLHVDSSNNRVGIGTTSPAALLTLNQTIPELRVQSSNNNFGMGDELGRMSLHTSDGTSPGAGEVFRIKTESASSIGADYTTRLTNRSGAGGGQTEISLGNGQGSIYFSTNTSGNNASARMAVMSSGNVGIGTTSPSTKLHVNGTVTATAFAGDGSALTGISAGATGGGSDEIFYENSQTVTTDYTITSNKNAMSAGPITINNGVSVTVPSGSTYTIV